MIKYQVTYQSGKVIEVEVHHPGEILMYTAKNSVKNVKKLSEKKT
jgi:hypothetical protein